MAWLAREHPDLVPRYEQLYARRRVRAGRVRSLAGRAGGAAARRHGLDRQCGGPLGGPERRPIDSGSARGTSVGGFPGGQSAGTGGAKVRPSSSPSAEGRLASLGMNSQVNTPIRAEIGRRRGVRGTPRGRTMGHPAPRTPGSPP